MGETLGGHIQVGCESCPDRLDAVFAGQESTSEVTKAISRVDPYRNVPSTEVLQRGVISKRGSFELITSTRLENSGNCSDNCGTCPFRYTMPQMKKELEDAGAEILSF